MQEEQKCLQNELDVREELQRDIRSCDEDTEWQLPEPGVMQTVKSYRKKCAVPLMMKLKEVVKDLSIKYVQIAE